MPKLSTPELETVQKLNHDRDGRNASVGTILSQIGKMTILGVAGSLKRVHITRNKDNDECGVIIWCGKNRAVEVIYDWSDTYSVRRYRYISSGKHSGEIRCESEETFVYCDQLADAVWRAGSWIA